MWNRTSIQMENRLDAVWRCEIVKSGWSFNIPLGIFYLDFFLSNIYFIPIHRECNAISTIVRRFNHIIIIFTRSTVTLLKNFKSRKRGKLLKDFSGIKIYRDSFKVRPYGDEGQFYDWLDLSGRVQRSPAAASHESGNWRVSPNQLIGSVSIGRLSNPKLEDTANREGMRPNREYDCFIEIIQGPSQGFSKISSNE